MGEATPVGVVVDDEAGGGRWRRQQSTRHPGARVTTDLGGRTDEVSKRAEIWDYPNEEKWRDSPEPVEQVTKLNRWCSSQAAMDDLMPAGSSPWPAPSFTKPDQLSSRTCKKSNHMQDTLSVPEMSIEYGVNKRQSCRIHQMQWFEWTLRIPPIYSRSSIIISNQSYAKDKLIMPFALSILTYRLC